MKPFLFNFVNVKQKINIQQQLRGFVNSPPLWKVEALSGLSQLSIPMQIDAIEIGKPEIRLGKRVEQFYSEILTNNSDVELLARNIQLKEGLRTIGELDFILRYKLMPVHLELVYKFYLFDSSEGETEIDHWIGPNRKDCLKYKLDKLIDKQLPMVFHESNAELLSRLNIVPEELLQRVDFRGQLFVPANESVDFKLINEECVKGFYYRLAELPIDAEYYLPEKNDWLIEPILSVDWKNYDQIQLELIDLLQNERSPLCWIKTNSGLMEKSFIVWW